MRDQLKLLEALQDVDCELQEIEDILTSLPEKLEGLKGDVSRVERMLDGERARLNDAAGYKNSIDTALQSELDQLAKSKNKMQGVKTSKEYMAAQREFETTRKMSSEKEEELNKLGEAMAKVEAQIQQHEKELEALKEHVHEEESEIQKEIDGLKTKVAEQRARREKMLSDIPDDLLQRYEDIRRRRKGKAVVQIERGVCMGCRMKVPPQLFNMLKTFSSIETCPNCQRIIYAEFPDENETSEQSASV